MKHGEEVLLRTQDILVRTMRLGPRAAVPWHLHTAVDDLVVCLSGLIELRFRDSGRRVTLAPGERDRVPARTVHQVANLARTDSEYLLIQGVGAYDFVAAQPSSSPTRTRKFDHPRDTAPGLKIPTQVKTPEHPKKSDKKSTHRKAPRPSSMA
jgi:quercetin dioxygenase-like cupin family protein